MAQSEKKGGGEAAAPAGPQVLWDDTQMATSYANVCNVTGTREEVALIFGTNQTGISAQNLRVLINNRIIVSPYAAKRLASLLQNVVEQYEKKFGSLGD